MKYPEQQEQTNMQDKYLHIFSFVVFLGVAILLGLIIFSIPNEPTVPKDKKACSFWKNEYLRNIPARCLYWFEQQH